MKRFAQLFLTASLALVVTVSINAGEKGEKKGKAKPEAKKFSPTARLVKGLELSAEQKAALATIDEEFNAKAKELKKQSNPVSKEQIAKAKAAAKAAKDAGKKGKELKAAFDAALGLTDEQKAARAAATKARGEWFSGLRAAVSKVLTEEQRAKLKTAGKKPTKKDGAKKDGAKKKDAAKKSDK